MKKITQQRNLNDWLYYPTVEESICVNPFHSVMKAVFNDSASSQMNPFLDETDTYVKIAKLIKADLILPNGDVIYVKERDTLHPLSEALSLLAYYMHTDTKAARAAADILESNFQGYFPISSGKVWKNGITLMYEDGREIHVDLSTLEEVTCHPGLPEFGRHDVTMEHIDPLFKFFDLINQAVGEDFFFEKTLMYPFNQRIREKSHVFTGKGGNGKSLFMLMVKRLYEGRAYTDAPQPNFTGHAAGVISYSFIGKRVVTFNDVDNPDAKFLDWLKRMITGNLEVKAPNGAWLSVPSVTNFFLESNHRPEILEIEAHQRRYVVREFPEDFKLIEHMDEAELDIIGERGDITAGDLVQYLMILKPQITDWINFAPTVMSPVAPALVF